MKAKISLAVQIKWTTWLGRECVNLGAFVTRSVSISSEGGKTFIPRAPLRSRYERIHALGMIALALSVRAQRRSR